MNEVKRRHAKPCETHSPPKMEDEMKCGHQTFMIDHCIPLFSFFLGGSGFRMLGSFIVPCSGLKLWIVPKEAQTTEEKSKEASVGSW